MFDDVGRNTARELTAEYVAAAYGPGGAGDDGLFRRVAPHAGGVRGGLRDNGTFQTYKRGDGRTVRYLTWKDKLTDRAASIRADAGGPEGHLSRAEKPALGDKHRLRPGQRAREFDYLNSTARVVHVYHAWQVRRDAASWKQLPTSTPAMR